MSKWGLTKQQLMELDCDSDVYLQWDGCPQGLTPAAPAFNIHLVHGFNTTLRELWRKLWILYTDDLLLMGEPEEHVVVIQRICSLVLKELSKKASSKCDRSVKRNGEHVGLSFTNGGVQMSDTEADAECIAKGQEMNAAAVRDDCAGDLGI